MPRPLPHSQPHGESDLLDAPLPFGGIGDSAHLTPGGSRLHGWDPLHHRSTSAGTLKTRLGLPSPYCSSWVDPAIGDTPRLPGICRLCAARITFPGPIPSRHQASSECLDRLTLSGEVHTAQGRWQSSASTKHRFRARLRAHSLPRPRPVRQAPSPKRADGRDRSTGKDEI
jgi:hypothetical protein